MKAGDQLGLMGLAVLLVAFLVSIPTKISSSNELGGLGAFMTWASVGLFLWAGIKGSRWWFILPLGLVTLLIWLLNQGH